MSDKQEPPVVYMLWDPKGKRYDTSSQSRVMSCYRSVTFTKRERDNAEVEEYRKTQGFEWVCLTPVTER